MQLVKKGGVQEAERARSSAGGAAGHALYKCTMDAGTRETPGPCPICGMLLDERYRVPTPSSAPSSAPTPAPGTGESASPAAAPPAPTAPAGERTIYVCDVHPEEVFDKPGRCFKETCAGMELEPRHIAPGSKLVFVCPAHADQVSDHPGTCAKCSKKLAFRIVSEAVRLTEGFLCPNHPVRTADGKMLCPDCKGEMHHMEFEQVLAIPLASVIDTGLRKSVFLDRGHGVFDAVEVKLGPRAGEEYPVFSGLAEGDRVVTAGAFLLDAEARLNPAAGAAYFGASGQETKK
ncbi:MAG: hypothetical protein HYZ53_11635 [Planctomycetes bacterium]|nr:hypothetical protein [Planctomycetota bacterium]